MCVNIDRAAVQVQSSALDELIQTGEEEEQAEQHLHHWGYRLGKLTEISFFVKISSDKWLAVSPYM